ncbi:metallophosphoesterase [Streptomyces sp. NBC_01637]|uniref:metallophosphoesterase n=1 Tax=unclassified Streptomyces TaxID=2593676 RepID=UPI0038634EC4|nr:metallophosphoesterase [Streptomyces sp. NBC_01653]WTD39165.1 metallophosphoesterase [Streptomyces sp. NBC_01643]WTD94593.1 metallophosphoesterase [Streptomyces sp. NBC_01637]
MVFVLAAVAVLALLVGVHRYVWRRFVGDTTVPGSALRRAGTVAVWLLPLLSIGALVSGRAGAPFRLQQTLAWPGFLWLAALLYLTLALLVGEAVRPVLRWVLARRAADGSAAGRTGAVAGSDAADMGSSPGEARASGTPAAPATLVVEAPAPPSAATHPSRRLFVARAVGGAAAVAGLGTVGYGTYGVLRGPRVKRVTVPLAKLPRSAHGFRIAVVSDIHLGPVLGRAHTQRIVDTINRTQPDLIAVVGDLVDGTVADLGPAAEPLAGLTARHGAFFVTGNHEYFSGAAQWVDHVRELGLHPLENARVEMDGFDLAGVNDIAGESEGQGPDFERALGDRDRTRASVLLAHQPVVIDDAVAHGVDLQLSGHTHGGQLWPGNYLAELANPTVAGLERYGDTQLYVSRGAGAWGPPVRVGAPSDITVVQLASRQA